jgi:hypothetical protein
VYEKIPSAFCGARFVPFHFVTIVFTFAPAGWRFCFVGGAAKFSFLCQVVRLKRLSECDISAVSGINFRDIFWLQGITREFGKCSETRRNFKSEEKCKGCREFEQISMFTFSGELWFVDLFEFRGF